MPKEANTLYQLAWRTLSKGEFSKVHTWNDWTDSALCGAEIDSRNSCPDFSATSKAGRCQRCERILQSSAQD